MKSEEWPAAAASVIRTSSRGRSARQLVLAGLIGLVGLAALAGAWMSLRHSFARWNVDPDIADPLLIWSGVRQHGLGFVATWHYTQDNWLLSLVPLAGLSYAVFGASPAVVIGSGWLIFLACVLLTALLAWKAAGPLAAMLLAAMLLFANTEAIGPTGFLTYPVTHNISLAWGLGALALAARGLERGSAPACTGAAVLLLVGAISDPWLNAAVTLPLLLVAGVLGVLHRRTDTGRSALVLCASAALVFVLARSRMLGLMHFLQGAEYSRASLSAIGGHLGWLARAMAAMFNIVPGGSSQTPALIALDCGALLLALTAVSVPTVLRFRTAEPRVQLLAGVALVSIPLVAFAYLVGSFPAGSYVGRFMINLYFLGPLLGALVLARPGAGSRVHSGIAAPVRAALYGYAALFALSGACEQPAAWWTGRPALAATGSAQLAGFLASHHLSYGYGPYWGSEANAVGWVSGGRVVIRPVQFNPTTSRVAPRDAQTSSLWYTPSDRPPDAGETFLIVADDGENCPDIQACIAAASAQFGPPARRLVWRNLSILVWPHELLSRMDK